MKSNPDYEVLLRTRTRLMIVRDGTKYKLHIGECAYSTVLLIPENAVDEIIENHKRCFPERNRGVNL